VLSLFSLQARKQCWCLIKPAGFAQFLQLPEGAWLPFWGAALLALQAAYVPGLINPLFYRWPNLASIATCFFMTFVFLISGVSFIIIAIWNLLCGAILLIAYYDLLIADLRRRP